MTSVVSSQKPVNEESVTVECPPQNRKMTSKGRKLSCRTGIRNMKSLPISDPDSTPRDPECEPYWNPVCEVMSKKLWLPTEIDWQDSDLNSLKLSCRSTEADSWFSKKSLLAPKKNSPEICSPLSTSSAADSTDSVNTVTRSRKIRIYPTAEQRRILKSWFGSSRFAYNTTLSHLKTPDTKANWKAIKTPLMHSMPEWSDSVPYQVKSVAMRDACQAVGAAKRKFKTTGQFNEVRFRSLKSPNQVLFVPKTAVTDKGVYWTTLGKLLLSEQVRKSDIESDCRLVLQSGRYYLIVPRKIEVTSGENQSGAVAVDPGLRTFVTTFSDRKVDKIGEAAFSRIVRVCHGLDDLTGRREKASGARKRRMKKALARLRNRVHDLVSELHHKVAGYLTTNYKIVIIPKFDFHPMSGNLFRKTVRGLATLAHGKFRQILASHAEKRNCKIVYQNEAYTSKTCSSCGAIKQIGSASVWKCLSCGVKHERDINGARGIFLRALRDTSWLQELVFGACISGA